jgi:hypothetical protein
MGTNPYKEKMPNQGMGREMGQDEEKPQDVNVQEIGSEPQLLPPGQSGLGTNFTHIETSRDNKDDNEDK